MAKGCPVSPKNTWVNHFVVRYIVHFMSSWRLYCVFMLCCAIALLLCQAVFAFICVCVCFVLIHSNKVRNCHILTKRWIKQVFYCPMWPNFQWIFGHTVLRKSFAIIQVNSWVELSHTLFQGKSKSMSQSSECYNLIKINAKSLSVDIHIINLS